MNICTFTESFLQILAELAPAVEPHVKRSRTRGRTNYMTRRRQEKKIKFVIRNQLSFCLNVRENYSQSIDVTIVAETLPNHNGPCQSHRFSVYIACDDEVRALAQSCVATEINSLNELENVFNKLATPPLSDLESLNLLIPHENNRTYAMGKDVEMLGLVALLDDGTTAAVNEHSKHVFFLVKLDKFDNKTLYDPQRQLLLTLNCSDRLRYQHAGDHRFNLEKVKFLLGNACRNFVTNNDDTATQTFFRDLFRFTSYASNTGLTNALVELGVHDNVNVTEHVFKKHTRVTITRVDGGRVIVAFHDNSITVSLCARSNGKRLQTLTKFCSNVKNNNIKLFTRLVLMWTRPEYAQHGKHRLFERLFKQLNTNCTKQHWFGLKSPEVPNLGTLFGCEFSGYLVRNGFSFIRTPERSNIEVFTVVTGYNDDEQFTSTRCSVIIDRSRDHVTVSSTSKFLPHSSVKFTTQRPTLSPEIMTAIDNTRPSK